MRTPVETLERRTLLAGLTAQYFDSVDFTDLKLTRTDATVDFTWAGAPDASMGADHFSVRWRGQVQPQFAQEYTFYVTSDDGVRLWVDGRLLIDQWVNQAPTERSGKITLEAGKNYDIRFDYYEFDQGAQARLSWSSASQAKQVIPSSRLFASPAGLNATYFDNNNFTGPTTSRVDPIVDFNWSTGSPAPGIAADTFSTRWNGYLQPQYSQTYTFYVTTDADSVISARLRVDGQLVVDSSSTQDGGVIKLEAGKLYDVQLDYREGSGAANVKLEWSSPTQARQVIPSSRLFAAAESAIPTRVPVYTNSVEDRDLPDPGIIFADGYYWMTHTMGGQNNGPGWPLYRSSDMVNWSFRTHLLTTANKPSFMTDALWAPEIHKVNGQYLMTGTSWSAQYSRLVIALATSARIDGPYTVQPNPIVADTANSPSVSVLDSHIFQDHDGRVYFLWKRDSDARTGANGSIRIREMNASGTAFLPGSSETVILDNAFGGWEKNLAEAPWMMRRGGFYYLFYSGAHIDTTYSVGVARGTSPLGPFTRSAANPILTNNSTWAGPGHGSFALDRDGVVWHLYHARHADNPGYGRVQMLDRVLWGADGWPTFGNNETPSVAAQTGPRVNAVSGGGAITIAGTAGADTFTVSRGANDSALLQISWGTMSSAPWFAEVQTLTINGLGGDDTLVIDHSRGNVFAGGGVTFNGGAGTDTLRVIGSPDADDTVAFAAGRVTLGTGTLTFGDVQKLRVESGQYAFNANMGAVAVEVADAKLAFNTTQTLGQLDLIGSAVATLAAGGSRILKTTGITIAPTARLDLRDNDLLVDYAAGVTSPLGVWNGSQYGGIQGLIARGRGVDGSWNNPGGIGTSMPAAIVDQVTTLAGAEASEVRFLNSGETALWDGVTIDATTVVVKYTWAGDLNLDGAIDGADYGTIDNYVQFPGTYGYANGDFNYDGLIDGADYGLIDNAVQLQGGVL